jgi:hypothetical protein
MSLDNFRASKEMMNPYMQEELFRKAKPKPKITYGRGKVQIGRNVRDGSIYTLDIEEACRVLLLGLTRCMPKGTLVKTKNGLEKIEDVQEVASFNFDNNQIEYKKCSQHSPSEQKIVKIKTKEGIIECSNNHKWIINRDGQQLLVITSELKTTDKLLKVISTLKEVDIIDIEFTNKEVDMIDLEVEDNQNFILSNNIITHNSGKTFLIRSMIDRMRHVGWDVIYLSDVKNEFFCVSLDQKIITDSGIKKIKDLNQNNNKVLTHNFSKNKDEYKKFYKTNTRVSIIVEIEMEDGSKIRCTPEHRLFRKDGSEVRVSELKEGEEVFSKRLPL